MESSEITSQTTDILADFGEVALDSVLEGVIKDIPILGTAVKLAKLSKTITDHIFLLKIQKFLLELENISNEEKQALFRKLDNNPETKAKIGECLVLIINRLDDLEKAQILAEIFLSLIQEKIDLETFRRLSSAIDIAFIEDLKKLIKDSRDSTCLNNLIRSGLAEILPRGVILEGYGLARIRVKISELGELFVSLMNGNHEKSRTGSRAVE
ncbi:hypothetical protein H6G64_05790 [Calothrix sp. FACHB-156]|nr:hypothetical protein [Calothrix sp. FACHB-156]